MIWFHGTPQETWEKIQADGIDFEVKRRSDPGDMGWGLYLTRNLPRARTYGGVVIQVEILEVRFAYLQNPYFLDGFDPIAPTTPVEKLFHGLVFQGGKMLTVNGSKESREYTAKRVRDAFLAQGYLGIITPYSEGEAVVFSQDGIVALRGLEG